MRRVRGSILLPVLLLAGCPTKAKVGSDGAAPDLPTLQITSPADGSYMNGTVAITVVASDGFEPATISLFLDAGTTAFAAIDGPPPYGHNWDTTAVPEGRHTIVAKAMAGSQAIASAPIAVNIDRTVPKVTSTTPATDAMDVVLRAPITVTFSEPIAPASLTSSSVSLTVAGTPVATTVTLNSDGTIATLSINDLTSFALMAKFSVTLTPAITDLAGNALSLPSNLWSWTVPDWIKYEPFAGAVFLSNPALAITSKFQPVVAYTDFYMNASGAVEYNSLHVKASNGHTWTDLDRPLPAGDESYGFSLALDANDHPVVAWSEKLTTENTEDVYVATWNGTAWGQALPAVDAIGAVATNARKPLLRLDANGLPLIGWLENDVSTVDQDVFFARWTGTQWDKSFGMLGIPGTTAFDFVLNNQGQPIVGWVTSSEMGVSLFNGTSWTPYPATAVKYAPDPALGLDAMFDPLLVEQGTAFEVFGLSGVIWNQAIPISIPTGDYAQNPKLATGPDHNPVIAWIDSGKVGFARWTGKAWAARAGLFGGGANATTCNLLVDSRGTIWLGWSEGTHAYVWMSNY